MSADLENRIEAAWEDRANVTPQSSDVREAAMETLRKLAPEDLALLGDAVVQQVHVRRVRQRR